MKEIGTLRQIFIDNWKEYEKENRDKIRSTERKNVTKMLICRTTLLGSHTYECDQCGYVRDVPHSCKSRFCSVCGYTQLLDWVRSRFTFLLDCWYHHVVVTIPANYRWMTKQNRPETLKLFANCAAETIQEWANKRGYEIGMVMFFHSFGAKLNFHPHYHILVTAGGIKKNGSWHYTNAKIPGNVLMPRFRAKFVKGMKKLIIEGKIKSRAPISKLLAQLNQTYKKHWQFYTEAITGRAQDTLLYCVRYAKKMIISETRIIKYDRKKGEVTILSGKIKKLGTKIPIKYKVKDFIKHVIQHIPEKHFRLIRYYGFYHNRSRAKYQNALKAYSPINKVYLKFLWRNRQWHRDGKDPLTCPKCKIEMVLKHVSYPVGWYKLNIDRIKKALGQPMQLKLEPG